MKVLVVIPSLIPSTIVGVLRPLQALHYAGQIDLRCRFSSIFFQPTDVDISWCDIAVFCRNCEMSDLSILYRLKRDGKKTIFEIDDNFEEIALSTGVGFHHRRFHRLHAAKRFYQLSDLTRVYSRTLEVQALHYGANTQRIKGYFDLEIVEGLQRRKSTKVKIAYPTGRIDDAKLENLLFNALKNLLIKYPALIELHLWRKEIPVQLNGVAGVFLERGNTNYKKFIQSFYTAGYDIGLAPAIDEPFYHSKTNNKYRELGGCKVAGVYSSFAPYTDCICDGDTGVFAENSVAGWMEAIERLVLDEELRRRISENAFEDVKKNYTFSASVRSWKDAFTYCLNQDSINHNWVPNRDIWPVFIFSHLSKKSRKDLRVEYFKASCASLVGSLLIEKNFAQPVSTSEACATFYIVDDARSLDKVISVTPALGRAIVDLTQYKGDLELGVKSLLDKCSSDNVTLLLMHGQLANSSLVEKGTIIYVGSGDLDPITQYFSQLGYPSAYLDAVEQQINYSVTKRPKKYRRLRSPQIMFLDIRRRCMGFIIMLLTRFSLIKH